MVICKVYHKCRTRANISIKLKSENKLDKSIMTMSKSPAITSQQAFTTTYLIFWILLHLEPPEGQIPQVQSWFYFVLNLETVYRTKLKTKLKNLYHDIFLLVFRLRKYKTKNSFLLEKKAEFVKSLRHLALTYIFLKCISLFLTFRSSRLEVFCKKGVLRNFRNITGKHLCQSLLFNKVADLRSPF